MIVGQTGSGKSVTWKMLRNTLSRMKKEKRGPQYQIVRVRSRSTCTLREGCKLSIYMCVYRSHSSGGRSLTAYVKLEALGSIPGGCRFFTVL